MVSVRTTADRNSIYHHISFSSNNNNNNQTPVRQTLLSIASKNYDHEHPTTVLRRTTKQNQDGTSFEEEEVVETEEGGNYESDSDDDYFDPCFFDPNYTIATTSAFSIWEGSVTLLGFLLRLAGGEETVERDRLEITDGGAERAVSLGEYWCRHLPNSRVVELGSGTGLLGLGLAFFSGASVMCTDVQSVVEKGGYLWENIETAAKTDTSENCTSHRWKQSHSFGVGSVSYPQTLDWSIPLESQRTCYENDPTDADVIVAAECVWLKELAPLFVDTVGGLLQRREDEAEGSRKKKVCFWAYKERGTEDSKVFTTFKEVVELFEDIGCDVTEMYREASKEDEGKWMIVNVVTLKR